MTAMSRPPITTCMTMPGTLSRSKAEGHEAHQKRRQDDAENAAGSAENGDATEDDHGDHLELPPNRN